MDTLVVIKGTPFRDLAVPWEPTTDNTTPCYLFIIPTNRASDRETRTRFVWKYVPGALDNDGRVETIDGIKYFVFSKSAAYTRDVLPDGDWLIRPYIGNLDDGNGIVTLDGALMKVKYAEDGLVIGYPLPA